ncbi:glycosyltransferase family 2 protein [Shimia biformata]|uniref:glycosyltransferase family 2 protein n=1 Tax=Shimia biformata TaxID=1294299 RepID=UPI00194DDBA8|nr:glycosyltransferase [Shimia biformata]
MSSRTDPTVISIIIPAHNEAALIGRCLRAVFASPALSGAEVIVVANGCLDDTADRARALVNDATASGWDLTVLELPEGGKPGALNAGDRAARNGARVYLDADVIVSSGLMAELAATLARSEPIYASGVMCLARARTAVSRAYGRIYGRVPFLTQGVPGAGLFAVNAAGRARWGRFPDIISDDTFVRLLFSPAERVRVTAPYSWPLVEGFGNLVRVRRRQNAGVAQIAALYPDLLTNDDKSDMGIREKATLFLRDPIGFAVYAAVALTVKLVPAKDNHWSRGR